MRSVLAIALLFASGVARATPFVLEIHGGDGQPLAGAVVQILGTHRPIPASELVGPFVVAQQNIAFIPHVLVVPLGAAVSFPNRDKVRHHVYSFSPAKHFELKLYGRQETRTVIFDKPGVVALGCNIHDSMSGFIIVADTPFFAETDRAGRARFDVPAGALTVAVWHPSIHARDNTRMMPLTVPAAGGTTVLALPR